MLSQISWADYISTIIAVTVLYYLFVAVHYYGRDILYYASSNGPSAVQTLYSAAGQSYHPASDEITAYILEAARSATDKETILSGCAHILRRHPFDPSSKDIIENIINEKCQQYCSVHLTENELKGLWPE